MGMCGCALRGIGLMGVGGKLYDGPLARRVLPRPPAAASTSARHSRRRGFPDPVQLLVFLTHFSRGTMWAQRAAAEEPFEMTKRRTTAQQRAREIQHAPGARLAYGKALESARRPCGPEQARAVLRDLAGAADVSASWRERVRQHLAAADHSGWPDGTHTAALRDDLHLLAGVVPPAHDQPVVPGAFAYFPLVFLHRTAEQGRSAFAWAAACALGGPLRHLLWHPYGQPPRLDDMIYHSRKAPTSAPRRQMTVDTPEGLNLTDVPYPRPWDVPAVYGFYRTDDARGRWELARAVLAHALGGAEPSSLAACRACHGNGWLSAAGSEHEEHQPAYGPDGGRPVCPCAGCRGTGLRPLPVRDFDDYFGRRLQGTGRGGAVARSEILTWAADRLPAGPGDVPVACGEGLASRYATAVVDAVRAAGFTVGDQEPFELDFDVDGGMGAHFYAGGEAAVRLFGSTRVLLFWYDDRGWTVTGFGEQRPLLPDDFVPAPQDLARALGDRGGTGREDQGGEAIRLRPRDVDVYAALLSYLSPAAD